MRAHSRNMPGWLVSLIWKEMVHSSTGQPVTESAQHPWTGCLLGGLQHQLQLLRHKGQGLSFLLHPRPRDGLQDDNLARHPFLSATLVPWGVLPSWGHLPTPARSATEGPECCGLFFAGSPPALWRACFAWPRAAARLQPPGAASSCEPGAVGLAAATSSCGTGARPATLPGTDGGAGQEEVETQ